MISAADLPGMLPVFPLPGALLLPRARLPLHIFEPRYLQMFDDALRSRERMIGMVQPLPARSAQEVEVPGLHLIGCAGRITQFSETEDGRLYITLNGVSRFRVRQEIEGFTPYRRVAVDWAGFGRDLNDEECDADFDRARLLGLLTRYLEMRGLSAEWGPLEDAEDELLINSLSMLLDFQPEDKQALLEAPSLTTRRETLVTLIEFALRGGSQEEKLQ